MALLWRVKYVEANILTLLSNCTKSMLFFCAVLFLEQRQSYIVGRFYPTHIYVLQLVDRERFEISCKINCIQYDTHAAYTILAVSTDIRVGSRRNERRPQFKLYRMVIESSRYVPTALLDNGIDCRVCTRRCLFTFTINVGSNRYVMLLFSVIFMYWYLACEYKCVMYERTKRMCFIYWV